MLARHQEQITPMVEVIQYHGLTQQEQSVNGEFGESKNWAAFFDVDELLVLKKQEHVDEILEEHLTKDSGALSVNWAPMRCQACHQTIFVSVPKCEPTHQKHTKVRLEDMKMEISNVHYPLLKNGNQHDTNGTVFSGPINQNGPLDEAAIHHYHSKSMVNM